MVVLAHQGGWDEIGMVAVPLLLVSLLLVVANRRASQELARQEAHGADDPGPPTSEEREGVPPGTPSQ